MTKKLTIAERVALRAESYKPPPEKICLNCEHCSNLGGHCLAVRNRGELEYFIIHLAGVCDLFEKKKAKDE